MDTPTRLTDAVRRFAISRDLVRADSLVLAAVSGGADSMALLSILHRLAGELRFSLAAAHFNHRIRPSAGDDLEHVRRAAVSFGIPFHWGTEDVPAAVERTGDSLEEAARKARYRFLHAKAEEIGAECIATGHTRTDHIETVLMRIIRGTGLRGLAGIPVRRGIIVRPLLDLTREDTVSHCRMTGLSYVEDPANQDTRFFRNRVRIELLPLLESQYHPGVRENLARLAEIARSTMEKIRVETRPIIEKSFARAGEDRWELVTHGLTRLDELEIAVLFGDIFAEEVACDMDFTRVHYEGLAHLVLDPRGPGKMLSLPGFTVVREHGRVVITRTNASFPESERAELRVMLNLPGVTRTPGVIVSASVVDVGEVSPSSLAATANETRPVREVLAPPLARPAREAYFDRDALAPPLVLRFPEPGDRMRPFGMSGSKKLSDIFIDKKIPAGERPTSLVIADAHDIIWLVGIATSEKCRVRNDTREIVRIRVERTGEKPWPG
jgi:tRNA(Ile)-lysidine synthase